MGRYNLKIDDIRLDKPSRSCYDLKIERTLFFDKVLRREVPVSYTHLDVYKRQIYGVVE